MPGYSNVGKLTFEQLSTAVLAWGSNMSDDVGSSLCGVDDVIPCIQRKCSLFFVALWKKQR